MDLIGEVFIFRLIWMNQFNPIEDNSPNNDTLEDDQIYNHDEYSPSEFEPQPSSNSDYPFSPFEDSNDYDQQNLFDFGF